MSRVASQNNQDGEIDLETFESLIVNYLRSQRNTIDKIHQNNPTVLIQPITIPTVCRVDLVFHAKPNGAIFLRRFFPDFFGIKSRFSLREVPCTPTVPLDM